jgi:RNA processing factor Prp31
MNLAKHPSSTVQILGAEKALFRYVLKWLFGLLLVM